MNKIDLVNARTVQKVEDLKKEKDGDNYQDVPEFRAGDTVDVAVRVIEGEKERIQHFKGIVISLKNSGINKSFLVRKVSNGVGVERIFPMFSPLIQSIKVLRKGKVRRSKLYYLRGMSEKKIRSKLS